MKVGLLCCSPHIFDSCNHIRTILLVGPLVLSIGHIYFFILTHALYIKLYCFILFSQIT